MERKDFISAIFSFFKVKDEEQSMFKAYDLALSPGSQYVDWSELYLKVLKEASSRFLPPPKYFIDQFSSCIRQTYRTSKDDGKIVRVFFKDGRVNDLVVGHSDLTISRIKKGNRKNEIEKILMYPKQVQIDNEPVNVVVIGGKVFPADAPYEVLYARA